MQTTAMNEWHLLRTRAGQERRARDHVSGLASEVLLPLMKVRVRRRGRLVESIAPLFPTYMFALLNLEHAYGRLRYTRGLRGIVGFGGDPAVVPEWIIGELKQRCAKGLVELREPLFIPGEVVRVADGPFQEFEGVFERYLSGRERVAILLSLVGAGARAVLPATMVVHVGVSR